MNILIAEDQDTTRFIVSSNLRGCGHTVVDVTNGKDALEYLVNNPDSIDILITDWDMPLMNGIDLAGEVRKLTKNSSYIYIILLTIKGDNSDLIKGFVEGQVDDYMVKPFSAVKLRLRLQVACRLIQSERALRARSCNLEIRALEQNIDIGETQEKIINRLLAIMEARSPEAAAHAQRVGIMSAVMGQRLGWSNARLHMLRAAALLHDIGKIGVRDALVMKAGVLEPEEHTQMRAHTTIGGAILSGSRNPVIQMAECIALCHHEHWDGSGYPRGLHGYDIPMEAQIVAVANEYDRQLNIDNREGRTEKQVLSYIRSQRERQFSHGIVRLLVDNMEIIKEQCWEILVK